MAETVVRLELNPRLALWAMAALLLALPATEVSPESVTLNTYYPAPSGIYVNMVTTGDTVLARDGGTVTVGENAKASLSIDNGGSLSVSGGANVGGGLSVGGGASIAGSLGIGTTAPAAELDVVGGIRPGWSSACGTSNAGTLRWNASSKEIEVCNGSTWTVPTGIPSGTVGGYCNNVGGTPSWPATSCASACSHSGGTCPGTYYVTSCAVGWTPFEGGAWNPGSTTYTSWSSCIKN